MAPKFSAVGAGYIWHVVTADTVVIGDAVKRGPRQWVATITTPDGLPLRNQHGGVTSGHGETRTIAVDRALTNHLHPQAAWLAMMNH